MTGKTIICLANNYFFDPTSKHHVMRELSKNNHVLWINWHASRRPSLNKRDLSSIANKLKQFSQGVIKIHDRFWVLTPIVLPLPASKMAQRLNRWLIIQQCRAALRKLPGQRQLWSFTPDIIPLLGSFNEEKVIYYCVDEFAAFSGYDIDATRRFDRELCQRADLVITTSESLYNGKKVYNPHTVQVRHGVLYQHFAQALAADFPIADDLANIPGPRVGYYGLISDWQDLDLVADLARARPRWSFVMVGKVQVDIGKYQSIANLHFLGQKQHSVLPHYSRGFDVAMIPHKINELTRNMNPIKLREYLAAGLPVVSSPLPEVKVYEPEVRLADSREQWLTALETAIADRNPTADAERSALVAEEDWSAKVQEIGEMIDSLESVTRNSSSVRTTSTI